MKASAWYNRLWQSKLNQVPLKEDADSAWANMRSLLDQQLPVNHAPASHMAKPTSINVVKFIAYSITLATVITPAAYFMLHSPGKHTSAVKRGTKQQHLQTDTTPFHQQKSPLLPKSNNAADSNKLSVTDSPDNPVTVKTPYLQAQGNQPLDAQQNAGNGDRAGAGSDHNNPVEQSTIKKNPLRTETLGNNTKTNVSVLNNTPRLAEKNGTVTGSSAKKALSNAESTGNYNNRSVAYLAAKQTYAKRQTRHQQHTGESNNLFGTQSEPALLSASSTPFTGGYQLDDSGSAKIYPFAKAVSGYEQTTAQQKKGTHAKSVKPKTNKANKGKNAKPVNSPTANYGLWAGTAFGNHTKNFYLGAFGAYKIKGFWLLEAGLRLNTLTTITQQYTHASYYRPDSLPGFTINDTRKILALDIPIHITYQVSNFISIKAGPVISLPLKQSHISYQFSPIADRRDTLRYTTRIDSALKHTTISKVSLGFNGGIDFNIRRFSIGAYYQILMPYKLNNDFGAYKKRSQAVQLGLTYRFK